MERAKVADKLIPLSDHIVNGCIGLLGSLHFNKEHPQHLYSICSYASMLEFAGDINALARSDRATGIPVVLRSMLEAFACLRCCVGDPNHFKVMYASFTEQKLKLLRSISSNPQNPYLIRLSETENVARSVAVLEAELEGFRAQKRGPLNHFEVFDKAGLKAEYQSLYWQLCMHSHNNVSALEDRHIEKNGPDYEVTLWKEVDPKDTIRYLDSMCGMLLDATEQLHALLESGKIEEVNALRASLAEIRLLYELPVMRQK